MKHLAFHANPDADGVRTLRFESRSALPVSAACVVANGFRALLADALCAPATVRLYEPAVPDERAWKAIVAGAALFRVRGTVCDATIVLRAADALALAACAFGEEASTSRPLSALEERAAARIADALVPHLAAVCGTPSEAGAEPCASAEDHTTYFEIELTAPVRCRIGIALSREPAQATGPALRLSDLATVPLQLSAVAELGELTAGALGRLEPGGFVPMIHTNGTPRAALLLDGAPVAEGEVGVANGRYAITLGRILAQEPI